MIKKGMVVKVLIVFLMILFLAIASPLIVFGSTGNYCRRQTEFKCECEVKESSELCTEVSEEEITEVYTEVKEETTVSHTEEDEETTVSYTEVEEETTEPVTEASELKKIQKSTNAKETTKTKESTKNLVFKPKAETEENETFTEMYISTDMASVHLTEKGEIVSKTLTLGEKVTVLSKPDSKGWVKISKNGVEGVIKSSNIMSEKDYLQKYQYLLAQILYSEAGGVSMYEMELVGEVVLNRLVTTYHEFANLHTLMDVLSQDGQYPETLAKIRSGIKPSDDAMKVAKSLLLTMSNDKLSNDCFWQTGFYPTWNVTVVLETSSHYYATLKK